MITTEQLKEIGFEEIPAFPLPDSFMLNINDRLQLLIGLNNKQWALFIRDNYGSTTTIHSRQDGILSIERIIIIKNALS